MFCMTLLNLTFGSWTHSFATITTYWYFSFSCNLPALGGCWQTSWNQIRRPGSACTVFFSYVASKILSQGAHPKSPVQNPKSKIPKIQNPKSPNSKIQTLHIKICYIMFQKSKIPKIPKIQNPKSPKSKIPKIPKIQNPQNPKSQNPKSPQSKIPKIPKIQNPQNPKSKIPKIQNPSFFGRILGI